MASFSIPSQIVENPLQKHFIFYKSLFEAALDKNINSFEQSCEKILGIKQIIKPLHTIEKTKIISSFSSTLFSPFLVVFHILALGNKNNNKGTIQTTLFVFALHIHQSFHFCIILMFVVFVRLIHEPGRTKRHSFHIRWHFKPDMRTIPFEGREPDGRPSKSPYTRIKDR